MNGARKEKPAAGITGLFHDIVGLPPGDGTPHGEGQPLKNPKAPRGGLTSDDPARLNGTPAEQNPGADE